MVPATGIWKPPRDSAGILVPPGDAGRADSFEEATEETAGILVPPWDADCADSAEEAAEETAGEVIGNMEDGANLDPPGDTGSEVSEDSATRRAPAVGEASSAEEDAWNMERRLWTSCVSNLMAAMTTDGGGDEFLQNTSLRSHFGTGCD